MNKYNQSQYWIQALKARQEQKQALETAVEPQEQSFDPHLEYPQYPQTVFSRDDLGHDEEEKRKIQQLYIELGDLPLLPVFAK